jgi:1-deoxy-D-xylulose-5-phosphate synthase
MIIAYGTLFPMCVKAAERLREEGLEVGVINARFAKPLDRQLILDQARGKRLVVTLEESTTIGGFGSGVLEALEEARLADPAFRDVALRIIGIPADRFVDHGSVADLRALIRLDTPGIAAQVLETLVTLKATPGHARRHPSGAANA